MVQCVHDILSDAMKVGHCCEESLEFFFPAIIPCVKNKSTSSRFENNTGAELENVLFEKRTLNLS